MSCSGSKEHSDPGRDNMCGADHAVNQMCSSCPGPEVSSFAQTAQYEASTNETGARVLLI
jgi:hypothetical protein